MMLTSGAEGVPDETHAEARVFLQQSRQGLCFVVQQPLGGVQHASVRVAPLEIHTGACTTWKFS